MGVTLEASRDPRDSHYQCCVLNFKFPVGKKNEWHLARTSEELLIGVDHLEIFRGPNKISVMR